MSSRRPPRPCRRRTRRRRGGSARAPVRTALNVQNPWCTKWGPAPNRQSAPAGMPTTRLAHSSAPRTRAGGHTRGNPSHCNLPLAQMQTLLNTSQHTPYTQKGKQPTRQPHRSFGLQVPLPTQCLYEAANLHPHATILTPFTKSSSSFVEAVVCPNRLNKPSGPCTHCWHAKGNHCRASVPANLSGTRNHDPCQNNWKYRSSCSSQLPRS